MRRLGPADLETIVQVLLWGITGALLAGLLYAAASCGSPPPPRIIDRIVTVPVKERCAPPMPVLRVVPEPKCSPAINPTTCTWPSAAAAADFIDDMERIMEWARIVTAQCAPLAADGGP